MSTFLYNPGVQVYIEVTDKDTGVVEILDVTEDITTGQLTRRSDGISQFQVTLQNPARKYDYDPKLNAPRPIFTPMDRIIVNMKRVKWMRVFTGYLDSVPAFQAWPGEVQLQASCTLKRLQYWFWDSTIAASEQLVRNSLLSDVQSAQDGGTANVIREILYNVVNWPVDKIHIGQIPSDWYDFAADIVAELVKDIDSANASAETVAQASGALASVGGNSVSVDVTGALTPGNIAGKTLSASQCSLAETIYTVAKSVGASDYQAACAICCSMTESTLNINPGSLGGAYGPFQQTPPSWGTQAQVMDPTYATKKFLSVLMNQTSDGNIANDVQAVQQSGAGKDSDGMKNYGPNVNFATQVVKLLVQADGSTQFANDQGEASVLGQTGVGGANVKRVGQSDQNTYLQVALGLVEANTRITYEEGNDSVPSADHPTILDCSSFQQWVYYHTLGSMGSDPMPRTAHEQAAWCAANGSRRLTAKEGLNTPGALMYHSSNGTNAGVIHTEMSVGDGIHTVGAHYTGTFAGVVDAGSEFDFAYMAPNITYSNVGGAGGPTVTTGAAGTGVTVPVKNTNTDPNAATTDVSGTSKDPIDKLFNGLHWSPADTSGAATLSNSLFGIRALLNDEPLLPYIINLMRCSMRSLCSAPNGDFMGWFPDYYGIWGTAAVMVIQDVELLNFSMNWSDLELITHEFVTQAITSQLNLNDGTLTNTGADPTTFTTGIATIDVRQIMSALFGIAPTAEDEAKFKNFIYARFGARVDYQALQGISGPKGEFFMALFLFMQNWAKQYTATMPTTFMPELWPGMLVQLPSFNFQAYVNTVTHTFTMGDGGGFTTDSEIVAPSRLDGVSAINYGLPIAGNFGPGRNYDKGKDAPVKPIAGPGNFPRPVH